MDLESGWMVEHDGNVGGWMDLECVWMGEHGGNGVDWMDLERGGNVDRQDEFGTWMDGGTWLKRGWTGWIWNVDGRWNLLET
ncbi:hypothetical protein CDAR_370821 [Caerostris darwini]|uniref:Uncharacterized protein n=1 Tax=Caerostris darwini TaxID=1538125 RepID=A0AAV4VGX6_9ARAC|nr:hypothetical protein CDAR_370821 [Caerostris darwini]